MMGFAALCPSYLFAIYLAQPGAQGGREEEDYGTYKRLLLREMSKTQIDATNAPTAVINNNTGTGNSNVGLFSADA